MHMRGNSQKKDHFFVAAGGGGVLHLIFLVPFYLEVQKKVELKKSTCLSLTLFLNKFIKVSTSNVNHSGRKCRICK